MTTTTALVVTRHGGPGVLALEEREVTPSGPGQARTSNQASSGAG